jgi:hypothetical protein
VVAEKLENLGELGEKHPSAAKADFNPVGFMRGLKPPPPSGLSFPAAGKARAIFGGFNVRAEARTLQTDALFPSNGPTYFDMLWIDPSPALTIES